MNNKIYIYISCLLSPFWTMIVSIRYFKSNSAMNIFWFGCAFMGFVHIFNPIGGSGADGVRYAAQLVEMNKFDFSFDVLKSNLYSEDGKLDIYQPLVTFLVSRFTNNAHYLFLIFAIVFGYFYSRNLWIVFNFIDEKQMKWWTWVILVMLIFANPIWNINGVRMWTALQIFTYGLLSIYINKDYKKISWIFVSIFFHFSFIIPAILLLCYQFLPKKNITIYFIFYFFSITFAEINIQSFNNKIIDVLPVQLTQKVNDYMNEDYVQAAAEANNSFSLYIVLERNMKRYFALLLIIFFFINNKTLFKDQMHRSLLTLYLFLAGVFEFLSTIPSMSRFLSIPNLIFYSLLLLLISNNHSENNSLHTMVRYLSVLLVLPVFFGFRCYTEFYGLSLIFGNFISAIFIQDNEPIISFIKSIL